MALSPHFSNLSVARGVDAKRGTKAHAVVLVQYVEGGEERQRSRHAAYPAQQREGFESCGLIQGIAQTGCGQACA
jgi:hypothetical protein